VTERHCERTGISVVRDTFFRTGAERIDRGEFTPKEPCGGTMQDNTNGIRFAVSAFPLRLRVPVRMA
jgi:hypothetical protein